MSVLAVAGKIVVTVRTIKEVANFARTTIETIRTIRTRIQQVREDRIRDIWADNVNADSTVFCQKMRELEEDVQKMMDCLTEYEQLLDRSAQEYETTQTNVKQQASALTSPTRR